MRCIAWLIPAAVSLAPVAGAQSSDRVVVPVCIGECPRVVGLRVTWRDRAVRRVDGVNVTIWTPYEEHAGKTNGLALGLPMSSTGNVDGIVVSPLAAQTTDRLRGIGVAALALGADRPRGAVASGLLTLAGDARGITLSGVASVASFSSHGIVAGGVGVFAGGGSGLAAAGLAGHVGGGFRGIATTGVALFTGPMTGLAATGGIHMARDFRGVSIALINYARSLRGLQLGALNIVSDGRSPRILPILNWR